MEQLLLVDHIALALEHNMEVPIAKAAALLGDRPHALAKAGIVRPGRLVFMVMRQQPMALHARRSLIPKASRRWATAFRLGAGVTILSHEVLQGCIVQHGVGQQPFQPRVLILQRLQPLGTLLDPPENSVA
ncbi:hypothetical protein ACVWWG_007974 [Bradyrhizobium sp. LB7.2]